MAAHDARTRQGKAEAIIRQLAGASRPIRAKPFANRNEKSRRLEARGSFSVLADAMD
jgi:hypothetical protein